MIYNIISNIGIIHQKDIKSDFSYYTLFQNSVCVFFKPFCCEFSAVTGGKYFIRSKISYKVYYLFYCCVKFVCAEKRLRV